MDAPQRVGGARRRRCFVDGGRCVCGAGEKAPEEATQIQDASENCGARGDLRRPGAALRSGAAAVSHRRAELTVNRLNRRARRTVRSHDRAKVLFGRVRIMAVMLCAGVGGEKAPEPAARIQASSDTLAQEGGICAVREPHPGAPVRNQCRIGALNSP